ncbi:heavy-metal-associated domain-containing protein [Marinilongibacter aquaticus]|uniref:heavy-metal-associated domain-containing protein n=1 Tax=Marinilongibacter aquaticus TaxID=2975157 RepID=UPI0021BDBA26|nr:heavy metal-associated domain-containing protein [Marinilongibacter aquaticus]UBM59931.1 heavy-metal-associated domain-containing protein [Marinilongibacter aquaticus]
MKKYTFETNINCDSCVRTVTPVLNNMDEVELWKVDTQNASKPLTVEGDDDLKAEQIIAALAEVGYEAKLNN